MSRKDARDVAFKLVFEYTFSRETKQEMVEEYTASMDADDVSYVSEVYLLLAVYEIEYMPSIPFKVSVDEAMNLAKKYSSEKSTQYINGVLSKFARK